MAVGLTREVTALPEEKNMTEIQIGKEVKLSLFAEDIIIYIENPKDATRKLLELIKDYNNLKTSNPI